VKIQEANPKDIQKELTTRRRSKERFGNALTLAQLARTFPVTNTVCTCYQQ